MYNTFDYLMIWSFLGFLASLILALSTLTLNEKPSLFRKRLLKVYSVVIPILNLPSILALSIIVLPIYLLKVWCDHEEKKRDLYLRGLDG